MSIQEEIEAKAKIAMTETTTCMKITWSFFAGITLALFWYILFWFISTNSEWYKKLFVVGALGYFLVPITWSFFQSIYDYFTPKKHGTKHVEIKKDIFKNKTIPNKKDNNLILPIENPAYYHAGKIIVKVRKFNRVADTWEHVNTFTNKTKAKKFAQLVTDKGLINTKYWIEHIEENQDCDLFYLYKD